MYTGKKISPAAHPHRYFSPLVGNLQMIKST